MGPVTRGLAVLAVLWTVAPAHGQPWWVQGTVVDAATGEPLPAATVRLAGAYRGTIANDEGEYRIEVRRWPAALRASHIGYASRDSVLTAPTGRVDLVLTPAPYPLEAQVVTPGDPAERIMARVIRNKQAWRPLLAGYRARAYTRRVLENDDGIVSIGETASEIFRDRDRGLREVVKSRRTTRNLEPGDGFVSTLEGFVDFHDDDIPMLGQSLIGPTHPEALEHYRFRLMGRRYLDDRVVFDISVEPKSRLATAFVGRVSVLDEAFALLEVELAPSRAAVASAVPLPVVEHLDLTWRQQFRGFGEVWLPVDYRFTLEAEIGIVGLRFPAARFTSLTRLDDYEVNAGLPDSLYAGEQVLRVDSVAVARDSTFAGLADKVPLSEREREAYAAIDTSLRLERAFRPTGFLARLLVRDMEEEEGEEAIDVKRSGEGAVRRRGLGIDWKPDLGHDRVGGAHLGLEGSRSWQAPRRQEAAPGTTMVWSPGPGGAGLAGLETGGGGAYDLGLKRWSWRGRASWGWQKEERTTTTSPGRTLVMSRATTRLRVDLEYGSGKVPRIPSDSYTLLINSAQSLLGLDDYFDWYWREGLRSRLRLWLPGRTALEVALRDEDHFSLAQTTRFNLLGRDWQPRPNPAVEEGRLRSLEARFERGGPYRPFGIRANRRAEVTVEHAGLLGGDFSFTRLHLALDGQFRTFLRRRWRPNTLDLRLVAGYAFGRLPPQRFGALEAGLLPFSPFGAFRSVRGHPHEGEHYAALYWEHDFRSAPFELLGLWGLAMRGAGLVVHGASGRTWIDAERRAGLGYEPRYQDGFRHEAGVSLVLFHLLRLDLTRRLDGAGWSAGASLARW